MSTFPTAWSRGVVTAITPYSGPVSGHDRRSEKVGREPRGERREARGERREARGERREARGERREARGERREARGERDAPGRSFRCAHVMTNLIMKSGVTTARNRDSRNSRKCSTNTHVRTSQTHNRVCTCNILRDLSAL